MKRPNLNEIPLDSAWPLRLGTASMTINVGAWDTMIQVAYELGFVLLEMDQKERPIRAFRRQKETPK